MCIQGTNPSQPFSHRHCFRLFNAILQRPINNQTRSGVLSTTASKRKAKERRNENSRDEEGRRTTRYTCARLKREKWRFRQSGGTKTASAFRSEPMNQAGCLVHNSDLCLSGANVVRVLSKVKNVKISQQMPGFCYAKQKNPTHRCMGFDCAATSTTTISSHSYNSQRRDGRNRRRSLIDRHVILHHEILPAVVR